MNTDLQERPSRSALASAMASTTGSPIAFAPATFEGLLEVSKMMAASGAAVPKHLRQNAGMCMSVAMVAYQNGFNPFLLAADTYVVNDILAWGAKSVSAMVNNSHRLEGRLSVALGGAWPSRTCTVVGKIKADPQAKEFTTNADTITTRNSPNWKQQPDLQLSYVAVRNWARLHMPEILLGLMDNDEAAIAQAYGTGPDTARDVTPARPTRDQFTETTASIVVVDVAPLFTFTDSDGACRDCEAAAFIDEFVGGLRSAGGERDIEGLWEMNSALLPDIRAIDADLAQAAHDAYSEALDRVHVNGGAKAQPATTTSATALAVPVKDNGIKDYATFCRILADRLKASATIAEFNAWQTLNEREMAEAEKATPKAYTSLMTVIDGRASELLGGEG